MEKPPRKRFRGGFYYVYVDGNEFTTDVLTITVKKTMPKLMASSLMLFSVLPDTVQSIASTGGMVTYLEPDDVAAVNLSVKQG